MDNQTNYEKNEEQEEKRTLHPSDSRNEFWMGALAGALVTALAVLAVVGLALGIYLFGKSMMNRQAGPQVTQSDGPGITDGHQQDKPELDYDKMSAKMSMIQEIINKYFLYDEDMDNVQEYVYKGMLAGLDDPYSEYYTVQDYKEMQESTEGVYSGIGAMLSQNRSTGLCTIVRVFKDSPADVAGMKPGDVLYKVEDKLVAGESLSVLVNNYIKGKEGTQVNITVYRQDKDEYVDMTLTRKSIEVPTVEHQMLADQIGYVLITQFDQVTTQQFKAAVDDLEAQGMKGLVLDLRSNPGGLLDSAVAIADYLLPDNFTRYAKDKGKTLVVYTADRNGKGEHYSASDGHQVDLPIAVLVNGDSASASEVLTGALKDYNWATVVGTTSYGKGIVQSLIPLGDGSAIKITVAHYYTPSGFDLHGKGITPDVKVELDEDLKTQVTVKPEDDNQVQAAVKVVKEAVPQGKQ